jgi:ElaA protein
MELSWQIKPFNVLTTNELYGILQLRCAVFVVEQNCVYQDVDFKDEKALHIYGVFDEKIIAYARIFKAGDYYPEAAISRVVVNKNHRDKNFGNDLIIQAIAGINNHFKEFEITISAQLYLKKFYEKHGFVATSAVYLEDDIEHIQMKITA